MKIIAISTVTPYLEDLCRLLMETVLEGASIGFHPPVSPVTAKAYWETVNEEISSGQKELLVSMDGDELTGSVQLAFSVKENARHRAEVQKLMVLPSRRKQGIGRQLMNCLEERAVEVGKKLLILDTRTGDPASELYRSMGYVLVGTIPGHTINGAGKYESTDFFYKEL